MSPPATSPASSSEIRAQRGARMGALVGAVGGLLFVVVNAGSVGGLVGSPWPLVVRVAGLVGFAAVVAAVLRARRLGSAGPERTAAQLRAYWWVVLAEVVAIPVGNLLLVRAGGVEHASLPWVTIVLGIHFVGFAAIFHGAGFLLLGVATTVLGAVGLALALAGADLDVITVVAGVVTGFVLLAAVLRGVLLGRRRPAA